MKNLQCQTKTSEVSLANRVQDKEKRISGADKAEGMDSKVKENGKPKIKKLRQKHPEN